MFLIKFSIIFNYLLVCISIYQYVMHGIRAFNLIHPWVSHRRIVDNYTLYINYFSWARGSSNFKRNSIEISVEYLGLEYSLKFWSHDRSDWVSFFFLNCLGYRMPCEPLIGFQKIRIYTSTRRLLLVDPLGWGVT